jgi:hypothetical protein
MTTKIKGAQPCFATEWANDNPPQTAEELNNVLDQWVHKPASQAPPRYPLTVNEAIIADFESVTGLFGVGKKMVAAGFWRLS